MTKPLSIRILKPGTFTSVDGSEHNYSEADLAAIAASYDPAADPAPIVIGHPKLDTPAYGWIAGMAVEGGELVAHADPDKLDAQFAEAVRAGRYAKVSASLYPPRHSQSPKPGGWYLKHVGFLGAAAPGVKGLGTVAFAECDGLISIETTQEQPMPKENVDTADFAAREVEISRKEAAVQERETAVATRESEVSAQAEQARHDANVAFAEVLVETGKLAPAGKDLAVIALDGLGTAEPVSFGEADGTITPHAALKKLFEGAGKLIQFGEHAKPDGAAAGTVSFAAPAGLDVSAERLAVHEAALDLQAADPNLSYLDAVRKAGG